MNDEPQEQIIKLLVNGDVLQKSRDLAVSGYEAVAQSPLLDVLPVVKVGTGIIKGVLAVDQYIFAKKVFHFLSKISEVSLDARKKYYDSLVQNDQLGRVGVTILEILDKSSLDIKSELIGALFAAHLQSAIEYDDFVRMSEMVNSAYTGDLIYLFNTNNDQIEETGDEVEHLLSLGFYERPRKRFGDTVMDGVQPVLSGYGERVRDIHGVTEL